MSIVQDTPIYRFGDFTLDVSNRELSDEKKRIDLNARYFDALVLLLQEHGRLVEKDRFFEEVWEDVVVSDSALTQCIKEIRRQLGDDAANPRFIQTVPRHGYRFIADVSIVDTNTAAETRRTDDAGGAVADASRRATADSPAGTANAASTGSPARTSASGDSGRPAGKVLPEASGGGAVGPGANATVTERQDKAGAIAGPAGVEGPAFSRGRGALGESAFSTAMSTALAATLGGAAAGLLGGLLYGFGLAYSPIDQELGTASVLLVLVSLTVFLGTVGGFGIGAGMAAADYVAGGRSAWRVVGAVFGGMLVGGSVKLLGVDAFNLLFGRTPAGITGGMEGAALGLAVGLGAHLGGGVGAPPWWRPVAIAAATGSVIGVSIALSGGHLLGGSLDLLAQSFSESRLQLDAFGRYFGEVRFGETTQIVLAGIEGLIFTACVVGALVASRLSKKAD